MSSSTCSISGRSSYAWASESSSLNLLLVPLQVTELTDNADIEPRLRGYQPLDVTVPRFFSAIRVPFWLIPEARSTVAHNVDNSPFYTVYRMETYSTLRDGVIDNRQGSNPITKEFTVTTGISTTATELFSQKTGFKVTAGGDVSFFGIGASFSVELNQELGWERSRSSTYSEEATSTTSFTVPARAYAQIVQVSTSFVAVDGQGNEMNTGISGGSSILKYLEYNR